MEENKIEKLANAIQEYEGWYRGSRSWRNCNPGNLKFARQRRAIGKDDDGFAIFPDDETGFLALIHQIEIACNGKSKVYSPNDTLYGFFNKFAPSSDSNYPKKYAEDVAKKLGISPHTKLKDLLI